MRVALFVFALATVAWAQNPDTFPSSCGPGIAFKVKLQNPARVPGPPQPGHARVVFIHDTGDDPNIGLLAYPTTRYALDGAWTGANHGSSWFTVSIAPGEHHICTNLQTSVVEQRTELAHFTAVAGQTYYYRTRLIMSRVVELMELEPIDSDQGAYLTQIYPLSIATAKR